MCDDYVYIIPEEPDLVPDEAKRQNAVAYFRGIAPKAAEVAVSVSDAVEFIHCGQNFGKISCSACGAVIELGEWQDWMDQDFTGKGQGFVLSQRALPCCGVHHSLHNLNYEWPQAESPGIGKLSGEQSARFAHILGCPVRVIYQHI
jgi:hypothetical protein